MKKLSDAVQQYRKQMIDPTPEGFAGLVGISPKSLHLIENYKPVGIHEWLKTLEFIGTLPETIEALTPKNELIKANLDEINEEWLRKL